MKFCLWKRLGKPKRAESLISEELARCELGILRFSQQAMTVEHNSNAALNGYSLPITRLRPFSDHDGLVRVGGRLAHSNLPFEAKHPVILLRSCHASLLIIRHYHEAVTLHGGQETVLAHIREKYWIVGARGLVKYVLNKCVICRKQRSGEVQLMADLPGDRFLANQSAFSEQYFLRW